MDPDSSLPRDETSTLHVKEVAEHGYTIVEDAIEPELVDALQRRPRAPRAVLRRPARRRTRSRATTRCASTTCSRSATLYEQVPVHRARAADRRGRARPGLPDLVAVVDRDPARRDRAADPRRRPAHPDPEAAPADGVQLDVGAHRLHRGERRDPAHPRLAPRRPLPRLRRSTYDSIAAEMPKGSVLIWHGSLWHGGGANTTDETPRRHRDELLRRLHPPAGEPAARPARARRSTRFSPRLRELVGYGVYNMLIGHINKHSPERAPARSDARRARARWSGTGSERGIRRPADRRQRRRPRRSRSTVPRR